MGEVLAVSNFLTLLAYEGGWPVLSLAVSSSHQQRNQRTTEYSLNRSWLEGAGSPNLEQTLCPGWDLNPTSRLTTVLPANHYRLSRV